MSLGVTTAAMAARTFPKIAEVRAYIQRSELPDGEAAPPRNSVEACASLPRPTPCRQAPLPALAACAACLPRAHGQAGRRTCP